MKQTVKYPARVLSPIKKYLKDREKKLLQRKKEYKASDPFNDADRLKDSIATDAGAAKKFEHEKNVAVSSELDKTLINIKKALTKIKLGKYGLCEQCGKMIDTDRLSVDPTALTCVECAKKNSK